MREKASINDRKDRTNLLSDKGSASDEMAKKYNTAWGKGHLLIMVEYIFY